MAVDFSEPVQQNILDVSSDWNAAHHITGILLIHKPNVMQVLEGPEEEVRFIFDKIRTDPRHRDVYQVKGEQIERRSFGKWSMVIKKRGQ